MGNTCKNYINEEEKKISISKEDFPGEKIQNKDLKILKKNIMDIPLFQRKVKAKEKYNKKIKERNGESNLVNNDNFMKEYMSIIELLLFNNTDKDIVSLYLEFIKKNDAYVKRYNFETFENEIKVYKLVFTLKEAEKIEKGIKLQSEKDILKNFLLELSKVSNDNDINNIFKKAEDESKHIIYFNYPIEFSNKELYVKFSSN